MQRRCRLGGQLALLGVTGRCLPMSLGLPCVVFFLGQSFLPVRNPLVSCGSGDIAWVQLLVLGSQWKLGTLAPSEGSLYLSFPLRDGLFLLNFPREWAPFAGCWERSSGYPGLEGYWSYCGSHLCSWLPPHPTFRCSWCLLNPSPSWKLSGLLPFILVLLLHLPSFSLRPCELL